MRDLPTLSMSHDQKLWILSTSHQGDEYPHSIELCIRFDWSEDAGREHFIVKVFADDGNEFIVHERKELEHAVKLMRGYGASYETIDEFHQTNVDYNYCMNMGWTVRPAVEEMKRHWQALRMIVNPTVTR